MLISEYVDFNGKKKYRVVLESYGGKEVSLGERLYKIIVLLEEANPTNLFLSYPKTIVKRLTNHVNCWKCFKSMLEVCWIFVAVSNP